MSDDKKWDLNLQEYADKAMKLAEKATDNYLEAITRMYVCALVIGLILGGVGFVMGYAIGGLK